MKQPIVQGEEKKAEAEVELTLRSCMEYVSSWESGATVFFLSTCIYIYKILGIPINLLPKKKGIPINKNINFDNNGQTEYENSALVVLKIIQYKKRKDVLLVDWTIRLAIAVRRL